VTDALLFLHLFSAACLFAAVVCFSAVVLGAQLERGVVRTFFLLWQIGILGVFIFGLALAIDIDRYDPWDAWVLIAIVLWAAAGATGDKIASAFKEPGDGVPAISADAARTHWIHVGLVVLLLADMVWKPWV
jgi:hypothetical protein